MYIARQCLKCVYKYRKEIGKAYKLSLARKAAKNNRKMCVYVQMETPKHREQEEGGKKFKKSQAVNSSRKNQ